MRCLTFFSSWDYFLVGACKCRITELSKARFKNQISTLVLFWWVTGPPPPLLRTVVFHRVHVGDSSRREQSVEPPGPFV